MTKIAGSGSIDQRHGSADPDPDPPQNVMDPHHWLIVFSKAGFAYDWISFIADVGGWTGTLIGIRYALHVEKIDLNPFFLLKSFCFVCPLKLVSACYKENWNRSKHLFLFCIK
jgi:hypothetical protein